MSYTYAHNYDAREMFLAKHYNVTPGCYKSTPLKQNHDPRFHVPSVRKGMEYILRKINYPTQRGDGGNALLSSSLAPRWLRPLNGFAIVPCKTLSPCSWSLSPSHPRFL